MIETIITIKYELQRLNTPRWASDQRLSNLFFLLWSPRTAVEKRRRLQESKIEKMKSMPNSPTENSVLFNRLFIIVRL